MSLGFNVFESWFNISGSVFDVVGLGFDVLKLGFEVLGGKRLFSTGGNLFLSKPNAKAELRDPGNLKVFGKALISHGD